MIQILSSHAASEMQRNANLYATDNKLTGFYSDTATNFNSDTANFKPQFYDQSLRATFNTCNFLREK